MASIDDTAHTLAGVVGLVPGLRCKGFIDDKINPPEAQVFTRDFDPRLTLGGSPSRQVEFGVRVFVRRTDARTAQAELRGYMEQAGSTSIRATIEDADNWDGQVDYVVVTNIGQPFEAELPDQIYWAVDFDVDIVW